ncbi:MAG TPA: efflux RND transporter periplasmic adaptor subunit [Candidatus Paceibacterota bacterium]|jgi:multidrug efflux pump subunit AcrA (membrane-fusion protein)|nr:hypothetical protein [Parcubacteria group bacterium]MDP6119453.1 efflux RND transporter periplasmic adaptor subunit [Candidatus Paceibacterota bacterium]HJN62898.1 efflux RND transporter periplasmic adaptor subunit [Candidatus Paceibacterota bacterium]|tara:strand:- start:1158 stop:2726 length:1569 start_codon:yes stop_codon:yes gene_type:complete
MHVPQIKTFLGSRPYLSVFVAAVVLVLLFFLFKGEKAPDMDLTKASLGNLVREINVTGRVKAAQEVDLGLEKSGRVSSVNVGEGDRVFVGQVLIKLENGSITADLEKAKANFKSAEATLVELRRGSRPEEITIQETKIENAESSVGEARQALLDEIKKSFTSSDDAIRNKVDLLFSSPRTSSPELTVPTITSQLEIDIESERIQIESILNSWEADASIFTVNSNLTEAGVEIKDNLAKMRVFLDKMALVVNSLEASANLSQTTVDSYQSDISSARTSIDTASSNISTDNEGLVDANALLNLENRNLELLIAGSDPQKILVQEALVEAAQADVNKALAELRKTLIVSPISGVVTKQEARVGEIIGTNTTPVSVISDQSLQVEVNVPESDVVLINTGNSARINLDAYGSDIDFSSVVVSINPGEIVLQGVPAYKTTIEFLEEDERIRPGMTADIFILADTRENVLNIPRRAVLRNGKREYVRVIVSGEIIERDVVSGFKSSDGRIEIVSGLEEGEEVIVFIEEQ